MNWVMNKKTIIKNKDKTARELLDSVLQNKCVSFEVERNYENEIFINLSYYSDEEYIPYESEPYHVEFDITKIIKNNKPLYREVLAHYENGRDYNDLLMNYFFKDNDDSQFDIEYWMERTNE